MDADLGTIPLKKEVNNSRVVEYMPKDAVASIIECARAASSKGFRDRFFLTESGKNLLIVLEIWLSFWLSWLYCYS